MKIPGRKKILFLHNSLDVGGAERLRLMFLKNIDRGRYDIKLCCINRKGKIGNEIERLGYKVDELGLDPSPKSIHTTFLLIKYLKQQEIDILCTSLFNSNFHGRIAALICRIPYVITEEHSEHYQYQSLKHLFYILSDLVLSGVATFIICCSETLRRDIAEKEKISSRKLITIENCIDPSFYCVKEEKKSLRKRHGINSDEAVFITVGSLSNKKGHLYLLEALSGLKREGFRFKSFLAGEGPLKELLYTRCRELGIADNVIFLGMVDNIQDYLNASDVFILPSLKEGLSIALIEAMYMALGCIVTDVGSNRELIKNLFNGIVVPPADKDSLKQAILFYLRNREDVKGFGLNSKAIVENNYLIGRYVNAFYEVWDKIDAAK